ncbi:hypothetical protein LMG26857_02324 [Achromobacter anxifer]|uniref:tetratricopeptide repeat protein n=1 Tax=Achromobacter anxifer TaxID=1287737 RepID=UPI00155C5418|nr:tetratricopeptide repeat protein [Achromobacter anxifer]CAB5513052.1 hypothetical protein LMG26857_02324 [Achromobacter anxifer]
MTQTISAQQDLDKSQAVIDRLLPLTTPFSGSDQELKEHLVAAWFTKLRNLRRLGKTAEEVQSADALAVHLEGAVPEDWPWMARAQFAKGAALAADGKHEDALAAWRHLEQRFEHVESLAVREWLARAGMEVIALTVHRGATFARVDMVREADRLEQRFGDDAWPATQALVAKIRLRKAELFEDLGYRQQALEGYARLQSDFQESDADDLREAAADAALAQARLLADKDWPGALQAMDALLRTHGGSSSTGIRQTLALAHLDRVFWWHLSSLDAPEHSSKPEQAVLACEQMEAQFSDTDSVIEVRCLGRCLQAHAEALHELADQTEDEEQAASLTSRAEALSEQHWQRHCGHADAQVRRTAVIAWIDALEMRDEETARQGYGQVLERLGDDRVAALQEPLARVWYRLAGTEDTLGSPERALETLDALRRRFADDDDAAVRLVVCRAMRQKARLLKHMGQHEAALGALEDMTRLSLPVEPGGAQQTAWRQLQASSMELEAEIWGDLAPPKHAHPSGKNDNDEPIPVPDVTEAERRRAAVGDSLLERFGDDEDTAVRLSVLDALYDLAVSQRERLHFEEAVQTYQKLLRKFAADKTEAIESRVASSYLNLAYLQMQLLERNEEALKTYDALLAHCGSSTRPIARDTVARANASRLTCLNRLQGQGVAVDYGAQYEPVAPQRLQEMKAVVAEGRKLQDQENYGDAIARYEQVASAHVESLHPELRAICLDALVNKGFCLARLGQREAAIVVNDEIVARYSDDMNLSFDKDVALALSNKAVQLDKLGRHEEELAVYDEIIRRWEGNTLSYLRLRVARAMWSKALTLAERDVAGAEAQYRRVVHNYLDDGEPDVRLEAVKACVNLGALLRKQGRYAEVIPWLEEKLQQLGDENAPGFAVQINWMRLQLARSYGKVGASKQQLALYEQLILLPKGVLNREQLDATLAEYRACKPGTGLQILRKKLAGMFGGKKG